MTSASKCMMKWESSPDSLFYMFIWISHIAKNFTSHVLHKLLVFIYFLYQKIVCPCKICLGIWTLFLFFFKSSLPICLSHLQNILFYCNVKHYLLMLKHICTWNTYKSICNCLLNNTEEMQLRTRLLTQNATSTWSGFLI